MADYSIAELPVGVGYLGIAPMPGRDGFYPSDFNTILRWDASIVLSMTPMRELRYCKADRLGDDLAAAGVAWHHLPVADFGAPDDAVALRWKTAASEVLASLGEGGRVFTHCYGGCGRADMAALRLMVEAGENAPDALLRLRAVRPCAVQTEGQFAWAAAGKSLLPNNKR